MSDQQAIGEPAAGPRPVDIGELIDASPLSRSRLLIVVLCALVVLMDGYDIQTMALAVPSLAEQWGLESAAFSLALSASVFGMLVGTAIVAPAGDRFGRRPVLIWGMALVGAASVATAFSATPVHLVLWRLLTGIGLGMSLPNATALTSEYVPKKTRAFLISAMYISIAFGALIAGFTAPTLIGAFGWRSIFLVGGIVPLLVTVLLVVYVPESVRLLLSARPDDPRIPAIVRRYFPDVDPAILVRPGSGPEPASGPGLEQEPASGSGPGAGPGQRALEPVRPSPSGRPNVFALFAPAYRARTVLLWAIFALNLFVLFMLISWLPTILTDAGWTRAQALRGAVLIQAGGIVGALVVARLVDRGRTIPTMAGAYVAVAIAFALFLLLPASLPVWTVLLLIVGAGVSGTQAALTALSAIFYPAAIRATGAGWASAAGRAGAVLAPLAGGLVLARFTLPSEQYLALLIPPVLLCAVCVGLLRWAWHDGQ